MDELTPEELAVWRDFTEHETELEGMLRQVYMDDLAEKALAHVDAEGEDDFVWIELPLERGEARAAFEGWWSYCAGNESAWGDIEDVIAEVVGAIGMALYPGETEDDS